MYRVCVYISLMTSGELMRFYSLFVVQGVVVVRPPPPKKKWWRGPTTVLPADGIRTSNPNPGPLVDWWPLHSTSRCPTSMEAVHKSLTFSCVFMLVQLNKCFAVCGSDLQRGHSGDGCF